LKESPESTVAGDDPPVLVKHEYRVGEALDEDPVTAEDLFRLPGLRDDARELAYFPEILPASIFGDIPEVGNHSFLQEISFHGP